MRQTFDIIASHRLSSGLVPEHDAMHTGRGGRRVAGAWRGALLANKTTRKFDIYGSKNRLLESNLRVIRPSARSAARDLPAPYASARSALRLTWLRQAVKPMRPRPATPTMLMPTCTLVSSGMPKRRTLPGIAPFMPLPLAVM